MDSLRHDPVQRLHQFPMVGRVIMSDNAKVGCGAHVVGTRVWSVHHGEGDPRLCEGVITKVQENDYLVWDEATQTMKPDGYLTTVVWDRGRLGRDDPGVVERRSWGFHLTPEEAIAEAEVECLAVEADARDELEAAAWRLIQVRQLRNALPPGAGTEAKT